MLPPHLSESSFRRYEPYITQLVDKWPASLVVKSFSSFNTFSCRFRDACRTFHQNGATWLTTINRSKFAEIYRNPADKDFEVVFDNDNECIVVRPLPHLKLQVESVSALAAQSKETLPPALSNDVFDMSKVSYNQENLVTIIAFLAHERLLTRPIAFSKLSNETVLSLENRFDIAITHKDDKTIIA